MEPQPTIGSLYECKIRVFLNIHNDKNQACRTSMSIMRNWASKFKYCETIIGNSYILLDKDIVIFPDSSGEITAYCYRVWDITNGTTFWYAWSMGQNHLKIQGFRFNELFQLVNK